jgi:indoleamine 2,3-dioxygenase
MDWQLLDRGFLPTPDPLPRLPAGTADATEALGRDLPNLVANRRFREVAPSHLAEPPAVPDDGREAERLFLLYSYFASAYVHAPGLPPVRSLPAKIAVPLVRLAEQCGRPPILAYASYCLHNWRRRDPAGPITLGNLELLQNFSVPGDGKSDEDWFILVHVEIENHAGGVLTAFRALPAALARGDEPATESLMDQALAGLRAMNRTLNRMPEGCSPEVYFRKVRPYIFGFTDVVYEGCGDGPRTYRGETGAQSSIIPTVLSALGIRHQSSLLTQHLADMRDYMPAPHRRFIEEQPSIREDVVRLARDGGPHGRRLREQYNAGVQEVIAFRSRHFEYAVNYIQKKVANPLATGGTPYVPWLHQLIEETKGFLL